jgi:hypothetical protein
MANDPVNHRDPSGLDVGMGGTSYVLWQQDCIDILAPVHASCMEQCRADRMAPEKNLCTESGDSPQAGDCMSICYQKTESLQILCTEAPSNLDRFIPISQPDWDCIMDGDCAVDVNVE